MKTTLESTLEAPQHVKDVAPRSDRDDALFTELAAVLRKHDALDRFGVTLLHRHFPITPGEVLLETTNTSTRIQTIAPVRDSEVGDEFIETSWRLGDGLIAVASKCKKVGDDHVEVTRNTPPRPTASRVA